MSFKSSLYFCLSIAFLAINSIYSYEPDRTLCQLKEHCLDRTIPCKRYDAKICKARNKLPSDKPVWIDYDSYQNRCYANPSDYESFREPFRSRSCDTVLK